MLILMGILQFGLIFAAFITVNNAAREGARWGSIYIYDLGISGSDKKAANDVARQNGVGERIIAARGVLNFPTALGGSTANFNSGSSWSNGTVASDCFNQSPTPSAARNRGDVTICYTLPTGLTDSDARRGQYMEVTAWYHQQIFMPLLDLFLPDDTTKGADAAQWLRLPGRVTVVIN